jgi:hypothetical protein
MAAAMLQAETEKLSPGLPIAKLQTIDLGQLQNGVERRLIQVNCMKTTSSSHNHEVQPRIWPATLSWAM